MPHFDRDTRQADQILGALTVHSLAMDLADHAARSEIELYAAHVFDATGRHVFDTAKSREDGVDEQSMALVAKALRYIELRGSALPYRLKRSGTLVWFEDAGSAD
jgi:hypothetical protein